MSRATSIPHPGKRFLSDLEWAVLACYYAFVFSIPFQTAPVFPELATVSKLTGYLFMMTTVLKPRLCYRLPGKAFYFFAIYLLVSACSGFFYTDPQLSSYDWGSTQTLAQLLILFWVSTNLMAYNNRIIRHALFTYAGACVLLSASMVLGFTGEMGVDKRLTALNTNPNLIAMFLMLGLLALIGLAYGRGETSRRMRVCFWFSSVFLFLALIQTGARGGMIGLMAGMLAVVMKRANLGFKLKFTAIVVISIIFVAVVVSSNESVWARWSAFAEGDTSGRDEIYSQAWQMIVEKPIVGWGPDHNRELGFRLGRPTRDFHNLYLHLLSEVGLFGSIPFFLGLLVCCVSAWRARRNIQGVVPGAMLLSLLILSLVGTTIEDKTLWFVLAYVTASETYPSTSVYRNKFGTLPLRTVSQPFKSPAFPNSTPDPAFYSSRRLRKQL